MKHIGTATSGNYLVEMTPDEWRGMIRGTSAPYQSIGHELREWRRREGVNQQAAARRIGISRNYLSMIERGTAGNLSVDVWARIVDQLGIGAQS